MAIGIECWIVFGKAHVSMNDKTPASPLPPASESTSSADSTELLRDQGSDGAAHPSLLAEETQRVSALAFEATSEGVVITDSTCRIVKVNRAFESITGYRQAEVNGRTCAFLQGPLSDTKTITDIRSALQNHIPFSGEILNYCKDGSLYWNDLSISPVVDKAGQLTHFIGITRDITRRKRVEAALNESEARYRDAAEALGGYILDIDRNYRYTFVSERAENLLGYPAHEMLGRTPAEFMPPGEIEVVNAWMDQNLETDGAVRGLEHRMVAKSGAVLWLQVSRIPLYNNHGTVIGYRGTAFDITARKQAEASRSELEAQLRESQKMHAIGTLAGGIAHDFNNIIAAILGNVALARMDAGPSPQAQESLAEIQKAATRARDLVKQILAFSRRQHTHHQTTSLAPVIVETARMLRATLPARVAIEVQCDPATPDASADKSQIQQILINLSTNAVQAMDGKAGRIRIELDAVAADDALLKRHPSLREFQALNPEGAVRLTFSDDGPGMTEAIRARIFEPFFTTKPVGEGTGLGLSVVHGIVQGHHGVIIVDSEPGAGTRFTVFLPGRPSGSEEASNQSPDGQHLANGSPDAHPPASEAPALAATSGPHIVYLDDDEALVSLVKRLLERRGMRVSAHHNQEEALAEVRANPAGIDLVLTDYNMPGISGLDVARLVREIRPDLPIAIASGFIDEKLSEQASDAGVSDLISKADSVDDFCAAIAALLPSKH